MEAIAARSSSWRAATTSSPAANPPAASQSRDLVGIGRGRPASTVITVLPGCEVSRWAAPRAASSKWGETTTTSDRGSPLGQQPHIVRPSIDPERNGA